MDINIRHYKSLSAQVTAEEYAEIKEYCKENKIKISDLVRRAVATEMEVTRDARLLQQCEEMIDHKLKIITIPSHKMKNITGTY